MKIAVLTGRLDGRSTRAIIDGAKELGHTATFIDRKIYDLPSTVSKKFDLSILEWKLSDSAIEQITIPTVLWYPDVRNFQEYYNTGMVGTVEKVDYAFVKSTRYLDKWRTINPNTYYFRQSVSPLQYTPPEEITEDDREKYGCDVVFAGSVRKHHHQEREYFHKALQLANFDYNLWGDNGRVRISDPREYAKMCRCSKVNVGMTGMLPEMEGYQSARAYQVWACGGFLLAKRCRNMEEYFPVGEICDTWGDKKELIEKCWYWIEHPDERREIAKRGREWFVSQGSSVHVMARILDMVR